MEMEMGDVTFMSHGRSWSRSAKREALGDARGTYFSDGGCDEGVIETRDEKLVQNAGWPAIA